MRVLTSWLAGVFLQRLPTDGGPIYYETDMSRFIVEPYNFASALFFFVVVLYWAWKLRGKWQQHALLTAILILLAIGALGGSLYHGFRQHPVWLFMDFMPIMVNLVLGALFFWQQIVRRWWLSTFLVVGFFLGTIAIRQALPGAWSTNGGYVLLALMFLLPLTLALWRTGWRNGHFVLIGVSLFAGAIYFRWADNLTPPLLPMGTHWLWHMLGVLATACIMQYIYKYVGHRDVRAFRMAWRQQMDSPANGPSEAA